MLQQYFRIKAEHPGVLLAMRVGDFYEFYGSDAEDAAGALEITLTGREDGGNRIPMAGVPFHSVEKYLARLVAKGFKVALCDQLEDPKQAKGLVKRGVTRVLTPGTLVEDAMLPSTQNNFLAALCVIDGKVGLATLDPSTGEFAVTELASEHEDRILQEIGRLRPSELLVGKDADEFGELAQAGFGALTTAFPSPHLDRAERDLRSQFEVANLESFGCADKPSAIVAASMILAYCEKNGLSMGHLDSLTTYSVDDFMRLDSATRRSLELTQNISDGSKKFTLLSVLDDTVTAAGSRLLRRWIEQPLLDAEAISERHEAVERLVAALLPRADLRETLKRIADIERLVARTATGLAGPRDMAALRDSLGALPELEPVLFKVGYGRLQVLREQIGDHSELFQLLKRGIVDEPPHSMREGGIVRPGFDLELDKLRELSRDGRGYIAQVEARERERTGISTLKVGFNSVFGYYLEVSKSQQEKVPEDYIRKQTTANAERYITAELKEHESQVLGADDKANALEGDLFGRLRARVAEHTQSLLKTARALAELDALASLAETAVRRGYVRPDIVAEPILEIDGGRHPVVEAHTSAFVPNDLLLGEEIPRVIVLTGPNMSGKSTYLRQVALIALMGQIGSFVPAKQCRMGLCDRIFARIGARDEIALAQSTFMVEMIESANILNHASPRSLVILDEVGRGTSTFDGMAIAWAIVERLAEIGAMTLFATHYHQLNSLAENVQSIQNFRVAVEEFGEDIVWTHRVLPGGADQSYGIHVAKMAGVPHRVLARASEILHDLESGDAKPSIKQNKLQLTLFESEPSPVEIALDKLNVDTLTPLQALQLLDDWKRKFGDKN